MPQQHSPSAAPMTILIAELILGAVASPPPDQDDDRRGSTPPAVATSARDQDDEVARPLGPAQANRPDADRDESGVQPNSTIVITARRLDTTRTQIAAGLGATVYSLSNETIEQGF